MTEKEILSLFDKYGALLKGHFKLSSGLHSEKYLQCALVLQYPDIAQKLSKALAKKFSKTKIDVVVAPALGGITIAYEVARAFGARGLFTERHSSEGTQEGRMVLRRGFSIEKGEKVLVVEDVITTGGSTKEVIDVVRALGGKVIGVGSVIDRSSQKLDFGVPFQALAKMSVETFEEKNCPLCKKNIAVTKPGSRK
ncbi:MAG: orotate phosphoribosyltransferase [Omnitrophica bacterium RIFCSPLOWO2_02_FULL_45_16]|nr:MAG: orotate phosphoribosyltransferase [Omnitrophica bacterium RIFCSPHIGHO2_02_FULL_46_20]OGW93420.1 MAG: orotate phosphoribosyltransferase [Omnitrophica bacterium RIFCSPLOWO2_01_FULL_45_24]OGX01407.1 MAG: orotate phosphoribosyltransferase [Omnitrophica bacterium RIFCSPLOWO2_02_FULL_45_16]